MTPPAGAAGPVDTNGEGPAASDYQVRALTADEHPRWSQLVGESPQGTLFHSLLWLEATGCPFRLFGCFRGDELRAGVAVGLIGAAAGHPEPSLTPYMGLLLPHAAGKRVTALSTNKEMTAEVAGFLRREFASGYLRLPPEVIDLQPFIWQDFQAGVRYTYRLSLDDLDTVLADMDASRRRSLQAAERDGIRVDSDHETAFPVVLDLSEQTFRRQGKVVSFRAAAVRIQAALAAAGRSRAFVARDSSGRALGGVWIVWDDKRAYYLVGGYDDEAKSANAVTLALWRAIQFTATELELLEFDFEGSMVPAVERFFRKFGGRLMPTYTVAWSRPAGLGARIGRKARDWARVALARMAMRPGGRPVPR